MLGFSATVGLALHAGALVLVAPAKFSEIAADGPRFLEIGFQAEHVTKLIGSPAKKKWFKGNEEQYPGLTGQVAMLYHFRDGFVTILYDKNQSARFVAIHVAPLCETKFTYNKGGQPTIVLNAVLKPGVVQEVFGIEDIHSGRLRPFGDAYRKLENGQVFGGEGNWGGSILYVTYLGRPGKFCNFILRQEPYSREVHGYGYFSELTLAECSYAVDHMFFPPYELW